MALYRCDSGGDTSTPITPSNSSPASMTSGTAYKPTANGYAIASYNNVTPSNSSPVALTSGDIDKIGGNGYAIASYSNITPSNSSPATISSGSIYKASANGKAVASITDVTPSSTAVSVAANDIVKIGGSGVIVDSVPTPTSITPSNTTPVALTADAPVTPTTAGYAIESYNTKTPSNATPAYLVSGEIDKMGGTGYAIESYTVLSNLQSSVSAGDMLRVNAAGKVAMLQQLTPSNTSPPSIDYIGGYYAAPTSGYVISSYSSVTPSSTPTSISTGDMVQVNGSGVIVDAIPTPAYLLPSNSSPAAITNGGLYQASASGYAISSYSSKTPSDTSPASVSSGAIIKAGSSGYLVKNIPVDLGVPDLVSQVDMAASASRSITVTAKPRLVVLIQSQRGSDGAQFLNIYDSVKDKNTTATYTAGGGYSNANGTGLPARITTVSATTVTVKNASSGYAVRSSVLIYY